MDPVNGQQKSLKFYDVRVLHVEDDDSVRESLSRFLKRRFKEVYSAKDGSEGLEAFLRTEPDLIITDIQMPIMNGLLMVEKILEKKPEVPVIITTAYNEQKYLEKASRLKIARYLLKPISKDDLEAAIDVALAMEER